MGEAVDHSFSKLTAEDVHALVAYLRTVPAVASPDLLATRVARVGLTQAGWRLVKPARQDGVRRRLR
jgi:hypothetical protein